MNPSSDTKPFAMLSAQAQMVNDTLQASLSAISATFAAATAGFTDTSNQEDDVEADKFFNVIYSFVTFDVDRRSVYSFICVVHTPQNDTFG